MHALVKGACAAATLAALSQPPSLPAAPAPAGTEPVVEAPGPVDAAVSPRQRRACPPRALVLDQGPRAACVALPEADSPLGAGARARRLARMPPSQHHLRTTAPSELIPRLPERPEAFADYQLPVDPVIAVDSAADNWPEEPRELDERARLGIEIVCDPLSPVTLMDLEGQIGRPEVVLVGELYGVTVVVRHAVSGERGERNYLVFYGNLRSPGPHVVNGARLSPLAVIGQVADGGDDESYLYFEVRRERAPLSAPAEHLSQLVKGSVSVAVDPRNVLPLRR